jgi:hypothetical protein
MVVGIIVLIISIAMAAWIYQVVDRYGGKLPWLWAAGAFVFWPLVATIAGYKYEETAMQLVGGIGLGLTVVGVVMNFAVVAPL